MIDEHIYDIANELTKAAIRSDRIVNCSDCAKDAYEYYKKMVSELTEKRNKETQKNM